MTGTVKHHKKPSRQQILDVSGLHVSFFGDLGELPVVRDLSFDILPGETLALVGESGSGKSTIMRAISGINPPRDGAITLEEQCLN